MDNANAAQSDYWNGPSGAKWVTHDDWMTAHHAPVTALLMDRSGIRPGDVVLDLGCGTGFSTRAAAGLAGPGGQVTGLDISEALLAAARMRGGDRGAATVDYIHADAQVHDFITQSVDRIVSQFGVMFFADPVAAFANIRRAARPGATMTLACWGPLDGNPWFAIPKAAGEAELEPLPPAPGDPSPLAFADTEKVHGILAAAGWVEPSSEPVAVDLTPPGDLGEVAAMSLRLGPVARLILHHRSGEDVADRIAARIRKDLEGFETPEGLRVPATINLFTAHAPA